MFDEASYTLTVEPFQTICASPASDWSSIRPRPSFVAHSRPLASDIRAEPALPSNAPDGKSLFVNFTRAVMPAGAGAASASLIALSSGFAGGTGPPPRAATAIAAPIAPTTSTAATRRASRRVEAVRRNLMALLSGTVPRLL